MRSEGDFPIEFVGAYRRIEGAFMSPKRSEQLLKAENPVEDMGLADLVTRRDDGRCHEGTTADFLAEVERQTPSSSAIRPPAGRGSIGWPPPSPHPKPASDSAADSDNCALSDSHQMMVTVSATTALTGRGDARTRPAGPPGQRRISRR